MYLLCIYYVFTMYLQGREEDSERMRFAMQGGVNTLSDELSQVGRELQ